VISAVALLVVACSGNESDDNSAAVAAQPNLANVVLQGAPHGSAAADSHASPQSDKVARLHDDMRKLWEDHITWTRLFIVSASSDLPDLQATTDRLLQNQVDIGDAIKPYYGGQAGNQLTALLSEHITTAAALLEAAKAGDSDGVATQSAAWYDNADRIAAFLNSANPDNWKLGEATDMMHEHLDLTLQEATAHLTGDYSADVQAYDKIHVQILKMADMLSSGIVAQFPDKFD
jgi:hypothetical protein